MNRRCFLRDVRHYLDIGFIGLPLVNHSKTCAARSIHKIKIGQIGTTHAHASGKMATLRKLNDDFEVVGIVEPNPDQQRKLKNHPAYRGLKWLSEEQLLNTRGLQAVAVETSITELVSTGMRCISAGMHIHLDKPAGRSITEFRALLDAATRRKLTVQMGYMFRHNPAFKFCFQAVRKGWLGDVFEVDGVISKIIDAQRRRELALYPGSMFELGCHLIDAMVKVLGRPDKITSFTRRTRSQQDNLADNQLAVFEYPQSTAMMRSTLIEVAGQNRRQFVVCGDRGTIEIRPLEPPRLLFALDKPLKGYTKGYQEVKLATMPGRYDEQLTELARIIREEKESEYPPEHDLAVQEAVLKASSVLLK
jgi:predicted dehydrogenase